ncbi:MAG TPA: patatin-like phospholipase family protein [Casimicrobiaceae bacterium]|nr:patatin-like phospholipase family protein [Casimicrobiaceae bacterium]
MVDESFVRYMSALLPRFVGALPAPDIEQIVARLQRVHMASGEILYRQGDAGDCMHFVVTGRLEVWVTDKYGERRLVAYRSSGGCAGELALLTGDARAADVVVTRDSVLARLAKDDYDALVDKHPQAGLCLARTALRSLRAGSNELVPPLGNIVLIPLHADVPIGEFGRRLELGLLRFGTTAYLDSRVADRRRITDQFVGSSAAGDDLFLDRLLDKAEGERRFVICETDHEMTEWTRKCIAHADRLLFVGYAANSPALTGIEDELRDSRFGAKLTEKQLILLHPDRGTAPKKTFAWLAPRPSYRHLHVSWEGTQDFNRLARLLSGNSVTLVLGGGGARGLSQIGAIRAIRESGTPIDAVGGTSIGAIIGALVALDWADERILQSCKHAFVDDRPLDDLTIPMFSMLSGRKLQRTLEHYVGDVDIEDLWQPFFCVSTNLSKSSINVHHSGKLLQALQASTSLPGLLPPVVANGDLYVDGGVLDNLPVGVMKRFIGGNTIAIESGVKVEFQMSGSDYPSPLDYLKSRWSRRIETAAPTLPSLLIKSTLLGGMGGRNELREGPDLHLNPPMRQFGFLDWNAIYELVDVGYRYTQERLLPWLERNPGIQRYDESLSRAREQMPA